MTIIILATSIIALLMLNYYAHVTTESITINRFWALKAKQYKMSDVMNIDQVLSNKKEAGRISRCPHYAVTFNDGQLLSFDGDCFNYDLDQQKELMNFISKHSGIPITTKNPYPQK